MGKALDQAIAPNPWRDPEGYQAFWRQVTDDGRVPCALEGTQCHRCHGTGKAQGFVIDTTGEQAQITDRCLRCDGTGKIPCSKILDAHHYVPKRKLRTPQAKLDVRNGVPLCRDHHDLVEEKVLKSPRPPELPFFLVEHDIPDMDLP